ADGRALGDRGLYGLAGRGHVPEREGIVQRLLALEEGPRLRGVGVPAPDENARRDLADAELLDESRNVPVRARTDRPGARLHRPTTLRSASDGAAAPARRSAAADCGDHVDA